MVIKLDSLNNKKTASDLIINFGKSRKHTFQFLKINVENGIDEYGVKLFI